MSPGDFEDQLKAGIDSVGLPGPGHDPRRATLAVGRERMALRPREWPMHRPHQTDVRFTRHRRRAHPQFAPNCRSGCRKSSPTTSIATGSASSPCCRARVRPRVRRSSPPTSPAYFVSRPAEFNRIVETVLDATRKNPSGKTVVLHGSGGFGKTTLALSVCHDPDVFAACDDGVSVGDARRTAADRRRARADIRSVDG